MSFTFNTPKTDATPGISFGTPAGDSKAANKPFGTTTVQPVLGGFGQKPATAFSLSSIQPPAQTTGLNFGTGAAPASTGFGTGAVPASTGFGAVAAPAPTGFGAGAAPASTGFGAGAAPASTGFGAGAAPASTGFGFGTPKAATTTTSTGFSLGSTPSTGLSTGFGFATPVPAVATTAVAASGFNLGTTPASSAPNFNLGGSAVSAAPAFNLSASAAKTTSLSFGAQALTTPTVAPSLNKAPTPATMASTAAPTSGFGLNTSAAKTTASFAFGPTTTATTAGLSLTGAISTTSTALTTSAIPTTGTLTFTQLEDAINKWTIDLEEQGKLFANQAKQLNAWDRLLISNGDKVLSLNNGIERVKQQQQQLDQELDFVLAQHKELEDLLSPLEKELEEIPITDVDRGNTYQIAENIDTQLKQMTEDLKEIIEQLNESNKTQEMSNPITQIGKILNAHMNSLQWIDHNTTKITTHLDQISKMHDLNRKSHEINLKRTYD